MGTVIERLNERGQLTPMATIKPITARYFRPSTAALRRELRDRRSPRRRKCQVYGWLLYRRQHTGGR